MAGAVTHDLTQEAADLAGVIAGVGADSTTVLRPGITNLVNKVWVLSVGGVAQPGAFWPRHVTPWEGGSCVVAISTPKGGQSLTYVIAMVGNAPSGAPTGTVTVVPAGSPTITVEVNKVPLTVRLGGGYSPTVGDEAILLWSGNQVFAMAKVTTTAASGPASTPVPTAPPPPPPITGTSNFGAQDSATWTDGYNWNSYFGQNVYSGSGYVPRSTGSWFYGGSTRGLADKTNITAVRFFLGARKNAGSYNSPATVHFYRHNNDVRGGGEPARTDGPYDISIPAGWGGGWLTLPQSFGVALKGGGGISIAGDPYVGFASGGAQPDSGTLSIDWSK